MGVELNLKKIKIQFIQPQTIERAQVLLLQYIILLLLKVIIKMATTYIHTLN